MMRNVKTIREGEMWQVDFGHLPYWEGSVFDSVQMASSFTYSAPDGYIRKSQNFLVIRSPVEVHQKSSGVFLIEILCEGRNLWVPITKLHSTWFKATINRIDESSEWAELGEV